MDNQKVVYLGFFPTVLTEIYKMWFHLYIRSTIVAQNVTKGKKRPIKCTFFVTMPDWLEGNQPNAMLPTTYPQLIIIIHVCH